MTIIVEDGTGLANSVSYASVSFADTYFLVRNVAAWALLTSPVKEGCLVLATDYINNRFGPYFKGIRTYPDVQALSFPRTPFILIPIDLQKATCEYALRASVSALAPDIEVSASGFQESEIYSKVGPIEERISYATIGQGSNRILLKPYPAADMFMRPFLAAIGGQVIRN